MPKFTIPLKIRFREKANTRLFREVVDQFVANPDILVLLLRQAMSETLLVEYRKRFDDKYIPMHTMEMYGRERGQGSPDSNEAERGNIQHRIAALQRTIARLKSQRDPNFDAIADIQVEIDQLVDSQYGLDAAIDQGQATTSGRERKEDGLTEVGGGAMALQNQYRPLMDKIRALLTSETNIKSEFVNGRITLGIGKVESLDKIKTPSATPGGTNSPYNIMWRQLEFGTGIFAKKGPFFRSEGTHKDDTGAGGWWYGGLGEGKSRRRLHLKGTRGGHFLLREGSGLAYTGDGAKFETLFALMLSRELFGSKAAA